MKLKAFENRIRSINDRRANAAFIADIEKTFNYAPLTMMEMGCLRGTLVQEFLKRGHQAIGVEGIEQTEGAWPALSGKNLFACDFSEPFTILANPGVDNEPLQCDCMIGINVANLMLPDHLSKFFENVRKHLKIGGMFYGSIDLSEHFPPTQTLRYWQFHLLRRLPGLRYIDYPYNHSPYPAFTACYYVLARDN